MSEARKLRKLRRRARRLGRAVVRSLRKDNELRALGVRFMSRDEDLTVEYVKGVRVFFVAAGGHIESSTMRTEQVKVNRDSVGLHVEDFEENLDDSDRWAKLQAIACDQMRSKIRDRVQLLIKTAYVDAPGRERAPKGLTFGVWPAGIKIKAWIEQDNWYFHVMMKMPVGGFVMPAANPHIPMTQVS